MSGEDDLDEYVDREGVNKPKPYIYLHAMKELGGLAENTIVIEDSLPGVIAGVTAGCFTIAIPSDYTGQQDLTKANMMIKSFADF